MTMIYIDTYHDRKLRRNYRQDDPRRSNGSRLKDGYEYDGSSLSVRGEKGRVEERGANRDRGIQK